MDSAHYPYGRLHRDALTEAIENGDAFYVLDGLDEVLHLPTKKKIIDAITAEDQLVGSAVLTSRIADFDSTAFAGERLWVVHRIEPLGTTERQRFIQRYHEAFFPDENERAHRISRLQQKLRDFHRLAELAGTPLFLTLLCLVNRDAALPETRTELYEQAAELLFHRWDVFHFQQDDVEKGHRIAPLTKTEKHAILRRLAWLIMMGGPGRPAERQHLTANLFPVALVEEAMRTVLQELNKANVENYIELLPRLLVERNSVLCPAAEGKHAFIHRTFLEFYAAWAWYEEDAPWITGTKPRKYSPEERWQHLLQPNWNDPAWKIILILHFGRLHTDDAAVLLEKLLAVSEREGERAEKRSSSGDAVKALIASRAAVLLAAECYSETPQRQRLADLGERIRDRLEAWVRSSKPLSMTWSLPMETIAKLDKQAVVLRFQIWDASSGDLTWLEQVMASEQTSRECRIGALDLVCEVLGPTDRLWALLLHEFQRYPRAGSYQGHVGRVIDASWPPPLHHGESAHPISPLADPSGEVRGLDAAIRSLAALPQANQLNLSDCNGLTHCDAIGSVQQLESVTLWSCASLRGDESLCGLTHLPKLGALSLGELDGIQSLSVLGHYPELTYLSVSQCHQLSGRQAIAGLAESCSLKNVRLQSCNGLSEDDARWLKSKLGKRCKVVWNLKPI